MKYYADIIKQLPQKPIIVGHSLGGIIVQKLMEMDLGIGSVCINSGPPKGIYALDKNFIFSNLSMLSPLSSKKGLVLMGKHWYYKYVTNEMSEGKTNSFIKTNCVPGSMKIITTIETIYLSRNTKPILFISGQSDKSQPPIINKINFNKYPNSIDKSYKVFNHRTHNIISQKIGKK